MPEASRGTRFILIAITLVAVSLIIWKISDVVTVAFGGIVGAAVLRGLALPLGRRAHFSERWSITIVLLGLLAVMGMLSWLFGHLIALQAGEMRRLIPASIDQLTKSLDQTSFGHVIVQRVKDVASDSKMLSHLGLAAGAAMVGFANVALIFFLSIYFAFNPQEYLDGLIRLIPPSQRARVRVAMVDAGEALHQWLLAQLVAMVMIGLLVGVGLSLMKIPLALLLGVLAGLFEFIPVAGAILFTIPGVLVAFTQGPEKALYVLVFYVCVQQLESNVAIPLLQRWAVQLAPALTLLSVVIGGILLGATGVVFATPLAVVVMTLVRHLYVEDALEHRRIPASNGGTHRPARATRAA